jgi:hypothetical protein
MNEILEQLEIAYQATRQLEILTKVCNEDEYFDPFHCEAYELVVFRGRIEAAIRRQLKEDDNINLIKYFGYIHNHYARNELRLEIIKQIALQLCPELYNKWQKITLIS